MRSQQLWMNDVRTGFLWYALSAIPVVLGVSFGIEFVPPTQDHPSPPQPDTLTACSRFDGVHYAEIVQRGYSYDPLDRSTVAFFPVYPLTGRFLVALTGWDARLALVVASNLMLLGAFIVFSTYLRSRSPEVSPDSQSLVLAVFGLWPTTFFFRMTYSESTFLLFTLILLCGIARRWPLPILALLAGLVTAVRPVGVAATAAFLWYILSDTTRGHPVRRVLMALPYVPIAAWGLVAYMAYQQACFGNPLAFAQTQEHWTYEVHWHSDPWEKAQSLLAGEPIWGSYQPDSMQYWARMGHNGNMLFNLFFWNSILFVAAFVLFLYGSARSWLTGPELVLGLGLLLIPYLTRAYEMSMASHARFASVVIPAYIVLGRLLGAGPKWGGHVVLVIFSSLLMAWSALFAAGHRFY